MTITLSIIIPTYKRHASLEKALESVTAHALPSSEIIVVDQSPDSKEKAGMFRKKYPSVKYLDLLKPNLPAARNAGIIHSNGEIILLIDDDAVIHKDCFTEHVSMHAHNGIAAVAGRIKQMNPKIQWARTQVAASIDPLTGETAGNFDLDNESDVVYATGGHLSVKRNVFKKAGLFNERFTGNALFEDIEFSLRIRKKGYTIRYNPRAIVYHYPVEDGGCHSADRTKYLMQRLHNHTLFYRLHISRIPSKKFMLHIKNLVEFIARKKNSTHSIPLLSLCALTCIKAYMKAALSLPATPTLKK